MCVIQSSGVFVASTASNVTPNSFAVLSSMFQHLCATYFTPVQNALQITDLKPTHFCFSDAQKTVNCPEFEHNNDNYLNLKTGLMTWKLLNEKIIEITDNLTGLITWTIKVIFLHKSHLPNDPLINTQLGNETGVRKCELFFQHFIFGLYITRFVD